jgi:hypothetical protein
MKHPVTFWVVITLILLNLVLLTRGMNPVIATINIYCLFLLGVIRDYLQDKQRFLEYERDDNSFSGSITITKNVVLMGLLTTRILVGLSELVLGVSHDSYLYTIYDWSTAIVLLLIVVGWDPLMIWLSKNQD